MLQLIKRYCWVALLVVSMQASWGYALLGPLTSQSGRDTWQTPTIGYDLPGDIGTPRNIGEEYRLNVPYLYYCYDANFSGYFGSNGEAAVDSAIAIYNTVSNVNAYSTALYEVTENSEQINYEASELGLTDLGSVTLGLLAEHMGLAQPERYVWTLHDRYLPSGGVCPFDELYIVVQRNYDPITQVYSSYINDILYTYTISEACSSPEPPVAVTEPVPVDPYADQYTTVASLGESLGVFNYAPNFNWFAAEVGGYYTGLTRDDVGGLRYLYSTNNVLWESAAAGSLMYSVTTNTSLTLFPNYSGTNVTFTASGTNSVVLGGSSGNNATNTFAYFYYYDGTYGYGDYASLVSLSHLLSPAALIALYPGLVISSTSNYFILATNITPTYYFTNLPGTPVGTETLEVYYTTNYFPEELYVDKFANVYTNHLWSTNAVEYEVTTTVGPAIGKPVGTFATNTTTKAIIFTNLASADFFLLPQFFTNVCPLDLSYKLQTNVWRFTNTVQTLTVTNSGTTSTNNTLYSASYSIIYDFTNYIYVAYPVNCSETTNATGWYQGVGHIQYIRQPDVNLDPLTEVFFQPITNYYSMVNYNATNNQFVTQSFQRVLNAPDVIFSANDIPLDTSGGFPTEFFDTRSINYNTSDMLTNEAGPGTIYPSTQISFNKIGDVYGNGSLAAYGYGTNQFLSQITSFGLLAWGTFDGSTNLPEVYPDGNSIANIENQYIVSITPAAASGLPDGTNGIPYAGVTFTVTGGQSPYSFAIQSGTSLPAGLTLSSAGTISGTPTGPAGIYDFTIQLTDGANRVVDFYNYSITIH